MKKIKVGSLFDGIGGTPLSAVMAGAEPVWASEIEKWPISITKRHFPSMKHLGDITQINGAEIEPVDIIVGGSPCQDLSVAGKRAGLDGERSGLFMDQCRIIKEMRNATRKQSGNGSADLPRPRYMVWENVPGAFSSNKGEDFRAVLEEIARIADDKASIPRPPKGKWVQGSGTILGDGYSISWRTVDAQYWGVPQRRRRIYLVADFGGHTAPEICFEPESMSGHLETSGEAPERVAGTVESGTGEASELCLNDQGGSVMSVSYGKVGTLRAQTHGHQPIVLEPEINRMVAFGEYATDGTFSTMKQRDYKDATDLVVEPVYSLDRACFNQGVNAKYGISIQPNVSQTLVARGPHAVAEPPTYTVRRLTPLECERLQGYPDGWTQLGEDGKEISDTQRYKALGNSFAIPNAYFFISRCVKQLRKE